MHSVSQTVKHIHSYGLPIVKVFQCAPTNLELEISCLVQWCLDNDSSAENEEVGFYSWHPY